MIIKILVEVLAILAIATKEVKQKRTSECIFNNSRLFLRVLVERYLNKLFGKNGIGVALKRLDKLTQEEARMATVEVLKVTRRVDDKVETLIEGTRNRFS